MNTLKMHESIEELKSCPNCGSEHIRKCFEAGDIFYNVSSHLFVLSVCENCNLYFLSRRVVSSAVGEYYPLDYSPYNTTASASSIPVKTSLLTKIIFSPVLLLNKFIRNLVMPGYVRKLNRISVPAKSAQTILDFGCGDDSFLNLVKQPGRTTIGMDFTPAVISKIKDSGHVGILYDGETAWDQIQDSSIDFVRMSHVAEHLYNPSQVFSMLHSKLKPGGLLHIIVPNPEGISAKVFGKYFLAFADLPRHVMMYPLSGMTKMLGAKDFDIVETLQEIVTKDIIRSIFIRRNYDSVNASSIHGSIKDSNLHKLFFIPMWLSAVLSRSDRYHVLVKKKKN